MLQAVIQGALDPELARTPALLAGTVLGSLPYLPPEVALGGLAEALELEGWLSPSLTPCQITWNFFPLGFLEAPGHELLPVQPALLLGTPDLLLAVEVSWSEDEELLQVRLARATGLARSLAGPRCRVEAALISAHRQRPQLSGVHWCSWSALQQRLERRAAEIPGLSGGSLRLVSELGQLLHRLGQGGPPGMAGLGPASSLPRSAPGLARDWPGRGAGPDLADPAVLHLWHPETRWAGWAGLPAGPGSVLLPWDPTGSSRSPGRDPAGYTSPTLELAREDE